MEFGVLKTALPEDRQRWHRFWQALPGDRRDVYFHWEYVRAMETSGRGEACCAFSTADDAVWLYPFLKRPINPVIEDAEDTLLYDIETAYGYGGPVVNGAGENEKFLGAAWSAFSNWCAGSGVVGEFCRFHPLIDNHHWAPVEMSIREDRQTVAIDLTKYPDTVWKDPHFKTHRNMIRKADRDGCEFGVLAPVSPGNLSWFVPMYEKTHERLGGNEETRFGASYFERLVGDLGEKAWIVTVTKWGQFEAAVLVVEGSEFAHCHLMGYESGAGGGVTNCLLHGAALEAANRDLCILHLGGGNSGREDDPLFQFKGALSPDRRTFRTGTRCYNPEAYERLARQWEERNGPRPEGYFLFYRLSNGEQIATEIGAEG